MNLLSALPQDADVAYQVLKELSMAGKGWIWLGSDGATSTTFSANSELAKVMQGLIGVGPKAGEGSLYLKFLSTWLEKDAIQYPGVVHTLNVSKNEYKLWHRQFGTNNTFSVDHVIPAKRLS